MASRRYGITAMLFAAATAPALVAAPTAMAGGIGPSTTVTQPPPPVTAAAFGSEPQGSPPADGDGLIPNPVTPTGSAVSPPASCTTTFTSSSATSATVNAWIAANENSLTAPTVLCLAGTFTGPIHVWAKTSTPLLEIAPEPGQSAVLNLGQVAAGDVDRNQYWSDAGGVSIVDSRSVEIFGLTVEGYTYNSPQRVPAGIYVTVRSDTTNTNQSTFPHLSACYLNGGACSDIYLIDNTVQNITNSADSATNNKAVCGNSNVGAYGIAIISAGSSASEALQHVVVEGNTVQATRTGQSETVTLNGDLTDFLVSGNVIHDADNIGVDTIGWETGANQASHGLIQDNTVYDVDAYSNMAYGHWNGTACVPNPNLTEGAAGIYDDGGSYVWIDHNTVWNTNQGIDLDIETANKHTDHLLVSFNAVHDDPGSSQGDPSTGTEPPGVPGTSQVAGHDPFAIYIDAFKTGSSIFDVYVHDNVVQNESQHYLVPSSGMPVVDVAGVWSNVQVWHNTINGMGATDRFNPLFEVDKQPSGGTNVVDCNNYGDLTSRSSTVNGNFALPSNSWITLAQWQAHNGHGWDADSAVGAFSAACPSASIP